MWLGCGNSDVKSKPPDFTLSSLTAKRPEELIDHVLLLLTPAGHRDVSGAI
jgi:hypothetical protein